MNDLFFTVVLFIGIYYFLIYRPQQKHRKQRQDLMDNLRVGTKIITIGGIHGEVVAVDEAAVRLKIAENVVIGVQKNAIGLLQEEPQDSEEEDAELVEEVEDSDGISEE